MIWTSRSPAISVRLSRWRNRTSGSSSTKNDGLIQLGAPPWLGCAAEQAVKRQVLAPTVEDGWREQLDFRVRAPKLLHGDMPVNCARGDDVSRFTERLDRGA